MKTLIVSILVNLAWSVMGLIAFVQYWGWGKLGALVVASVLVYALLYAEFWMPRTAGGEEADHG